jgi:hypothetical protein
VLIFLVGLMGFSAMLWGIAFFSVPVACIIGGLFAMWWTWYVSIGAQLQMSKMAMSATQGDN